MRNGTPKFTRPAITGRGTSDASVERSWCPRGVKIATTESSKKILQRASLTIASDFVNGWRPVASVALSWYNARYSPAIRDKICYPVVGMIVLPLRTPRRFLLQE
jgi:hypothetical protein